MADNRKYYYLKLKENFFDSDEIKILESMKDGYIYSNILLKLYLRSLRSEGRLMYRNVIPYTPEIISTLVGHPVGIVEKALDIFNKLGLIEVLDNGAIYMMDIQNFIGRSSTEADRQRRYYNKIKTEKEAAVGAPERPAVEAKPEAAAGHAEEKERPAESESEPERKQGDPYTKDFEEFWEAYPRKIGKGEAYKKYRARLNDGWSPAELATAARNYRARTDSDKTEAQYIKHPKTFLSDATPFTDYLGDRKDAAAETNDDEPFEEWK